jgi:hypothetical protein
MSNDFSPMAFIDSGIIKIADDNGTEYIPHLAKQQRKLKIMTVVLLLAISLVFTFFAAGSSHIFFNFFNETQTKFFNTCGFFSIVATVVSFIVRSKEESTYRANSSEFNRAKQKMQSKIMELEKQLVKHKSEIQQIETQAKFNFKKAGVQEMTA